MTIGIYNVAGQRVETLWSGIEDAGQHSLSWTPVGLASGIYFCRLQTQRTSETRKIVLLK